jgi:hypothetical protein
MSTLPTIPPVPSATPPALPALPTIPALASNATAAQIEAWRQQQAAAMDAWRARVNAEFASWQESQTMYRWAVNAHTQDAMQREATRAATAMQTSNEAPAPVGKAQVVLACIRAVPPTIRPTEAAWAGDVMALAGALWQRMQADPEIARVPPAA